MSVNNKFIWNKINIIVVDLKILWTKKINSANEINFWR